MAATGITGSGSAGGYGGLPIYSYSFTVDFDGTTGWYRATYTFQQGANTSTTTIPVSIWEPPLEFRLHEWGVREAMRISEAATPTLQNQIATIVAANPN